MLAIAAFAAAYAVAHNTGTQEAKPAAPAALQPPRDAPAIHNLEVVPGIKPLRSSP